MFIPPRERARKRKYVRTSMTTQDVFNDEACLNTNEEVTLVENTYDDLGRIKSSKRHGNSALTTDYTYNVRSWMKTPTTDTLFNQTCIITTHTVEAELAITATYPA